MHACTPLSLSCIHLDCCVSHVSCASDQFCPFLAAGEVSAQSIWRGFGWLICRRIGYWQMHRGSGQYPVHPGCPARGRRRVPVTLFCGLLRGSLPSLLRLWVAFCFFLLSVSSLTFHYPRAWRLMVSRLSISQSCHLSPESNSLGREWSVGL